jgi:hypothetical protein
MQVQNIHMLVGFRRGGLGHDLPTYNIFPVPFTCLLIFIMSALGITMMGMLVPLY